jgi:hypothetical protein
LNLLAELNFRFGIKTAKFAKKLLGFSFLLKEIGHFRIIILYTNDSYLGNKANSAGKIKSPAGAGG